jgi:undecaprenyl pyrophosphate phosphatase UppP
MRGRGAIYAAAAASIGAALVLVALGTGEEEGPGTVSNAQAFVLGVVQGATELLPISSSGHLVLVPWAGDWRSLKGNEEFNHTFDVALHIGTLFAVVAYFWRDLGVLIAAWFRSVARRSIAGREERIAWFIVVATIPAALIGALGENFIASELGEPWQIAILMMTTTLDAVVAVSVAAVGGVPGAAVTVTRTVAVSDRPLPSVMV